MLKRSTITLYKNQQHCLDLYTTALPSKNIDKLKDKIRHDHSA